MWCLLNAAHKETRFHFNGTSIRLLPGSLITGRFEGAKEIGYPPSTFWRKIKKLEQLKMIYITSTNKFSLISITKWNEYQTTHLITKVDNKELDNRTVKASMHSHKQLGTTKSGTKESMKAVNSIIDNMLTVSDRVPEIVDNSNDDVNNNKDNMLIDELQLKITTSGHQLDTYKNVKKKERPGLPETVEVVNTSFITKNDKSFFASKNSQVAQQPNNSHSLVYGGGITISEEDINGIHFFIKDGINYERD